MSKENNINLKISSEFQERITDLISNSEYSKSEIAIKIDISKDILIRATNVGMIPSTKSLIKIAGYFNVSLEYLLGLTNTEHFEKSDNPTTFQIRLEELKEQKKITSCALATRLGFPRSLFATWKKFDYLPSLEILHSLSSFFKVSIDYLLGRTDDR